VSRLSETALVAALAALAVASAMVSWGSWVLFLRTRQPRYRGRHRTPARRLKTKVP
jgi:hypothetical protein